MIAQDTAIPTPVQVHAFEKSVMIAASPDRDRVGGTTVRFFRVFVVSIFLSAGGLIPATVAAQTVSATEQAELAGPWHGSWTGAGFYEAVINLRVGATGATSGEINWTLRKSPRPAERGKIGMTGVELVRGNYYANRGTSILEGYEKNDPNGILGLDKYRLVVGDSRRTMGGITRHQNAWTSQFFLSR